MGGPPPCPPFSICWCQQHPNHPACNVGVPIDGGIEWLMLAALLLGIWGIKRNKIVNHERNNIES